LQRLLGTVVEVK